jgi:hypothetical protein
MAATPASLSSAGRIADAAVLIFASGPRLLAGSAGRHVHGQPVQAVHDGERIGRGVRGAQQPADRGGRASQPLRAPRRIRRGQLPLEQLADDPEGEAGLQLGAGAAQHPPAASGGSFATQPEQRRLADAGAALDHQDAAGLQHGVEGPQLVSPLQ